MSSASKGIFARSAKALSKVEANELKATLVSTLFVFILMASYYILRPVRDSMASDWTDSEVSFLWNINFFVSAGIVSLYGFAISRAKLKNVVPSMYAFFALSFVLFYIGVTAIGWCNGYRRIRARCRYDQRVHRGDRRCLRRQSVLSLGECFRAVPCIGVLDLHGRYLQS